MAIIVLSFLMDEGEAKEPSLMKSGEIDSSCVFF